jgi:hypothetical protein
LISAYIGGDDRVSRETKLGKLAHSKTPDWPPRQPTKSLFCSSLNTPFFHIDFFLQLTLNLDQSLKSRFDPICHQFPYRQQVIPTWQRVEPGRQAILQAQAWRRKHWKHMWEIMMPITMEAVPGSGSHLTDHRDNHDAPRSTSWATRPLYYWPRRSACMRFLKYMHAFCYM